MTENRWLPVVGGVLLNLALGFLYAWSVFVAPFEKEFGWNRAQVSVVYTIAVVCFALTFIYAGRLQDRKGPKLCAYLGGILVSVGFFLASFVTSLTQLYIFFGVIVGLGNGFGYSVPTPVASKWFPDKRGLVVGLMVGGYGGGQALFGPLAEQSLIPSFGWRATFQILSIVFFIMTMVGATLVRNPPAGYRPAGWTPPPAVPGARTDFTPREMLATPTFYFLWIAYALGTTAGQMTISQLAPFTRNAGLGAGIVATLLVATSAANAGGRILSGLLSDTLGRIPTLRLMVLLSAFAMPALFLWRTELVPFFVLAGVVYWCYGTQLSVFASTTGDFFGTKNLGLNYGLLFTAWGFAGTLGPVIGGNIFTRFGDYRYAFFSAGVFALIAFIALMFAKPPQHQAARA